MNRFSQRFSKEIPVILRLVAPIVVAQLTITGMSFVDTIMAGQVSPTDLAAVAVAASFMNPVILFIQGILMSVTPLVAYQIGAKRSESAAPLVQQALYISLFLAAVAWLLLYLSPQVFDLMDVDDSLVVLTSRYLVFVSFGLPAFASYQVLRGLNEATSNIKVIMLIGVAGLALNVPVNYAFINGVGPLPAYGGAGCGIATAICNWFMLLVMVVYLKRSSKMARFALFSTLHPLDWASVKRIFSLGLPIGGAIFCEVTLFSMIALLLSPLGANIVAAHQIALNFTSMVFMLPLSIGIALTIRVGHHMGAKNYPDAQAASYSGLIVATAISVITAAITVIFRYEIIAWYTDNMTVAAIAAPLFILAATYQFSDAMQVCCGGALRGYQDTRFVFAITLVSFWPIGLGIGSVLTFKDWITEQPLGVEGFWWAMVLALTTCAIGLFSRLVWASNNPLRLKLVSHHQ
ncbi:MATE family efflux transporter [Aliagarivorans taiwanensis]|uniref:MATE family efflux transporter n=1 Tax=Aliagarivorans taiwanensis TaxID=561966 RepID=UPI000A0613E5|nr:MATE family efflux transporter [Aliagarivorans taiwanensis]